MIQPGPARPGIARAVWLAGDPMPAVPDLIGLIQSIVRDELANVRVAEIGVVTELFPHESGGDKNNYECTIRLRDSGLEVQRVPVATGRIGLAAVPNVDDLVLVAFAGGDIHAPVIVGRLYNDVDRPPEAKARECVYVSPDPAESGVRRVSLEFPNGNTLLLDDDKLELHAGDTSVTLSNSGDVEVDSKGKVVIKSSANTEVKSDGDVSISAGGSMTLKAGTDMKIEGLSVSVKGQTTAQLEGAAGATVKGALVKVAGTASFSPS